MFCARVKLPAIDPTGRRPISVAAGRYLSSSTVIAVLATDATLDKSQARQLARVAHDGIALAVWRRLRMERGQVEQQRDLLTTIVNALPDPVLITDADNSILLENRRAEALSLLSEVHARTGNAPGLYRATLLLAEKAQAQGAQDEAEALLRRAAVVWMPQPP